VSAPRILAVLCVRNEGAFVLDWLAHHRAAGITDFLVFSNDCEDGTDAMLDRLAALGWLVHVPNPGPHAKGPQWAALALAERHPSLAAADWALVIDIDEYVNVHVGDHTLDALLAALPEAGAITLTWRLFGNGGVLDHGARPVHEAFTRAAPRVLHWPWRAAMFKTLFRADGTYGKLGVHRPRAPDPARVGGVRWFDGAGRELPAAFRTGRLFSPFGRDNHALVQLNHYALGSMRDFVLKCDRGRANRSDGAMGMDYWAERNFCAEEDRSLDALAAPRAALRAELAADAALARLHAAARDWRAVRFAALMADEGWRALMGRLMMTPPARPLAANEAAWLLHRAGARQGGHAEGA